MHPQMKSAAGKLLREFCLGSIFDFFNRIGPKLNNAIADYMSAIGGRRDMAETDADTPAMGMP
jgi:hypothetical protein